MGRAKNLKGFTLLELLTAMTILTIVGLFATPVLYSTYRSFEASNAQLRLQNHLHLAMREIVDYIEASIPLPPTGSIIGQDSVKVLSLTKIEVYNFGWQPPGGLPLNIIALQNPLNYTTTLIEYVNGQILTKKTGYGVSGSVVRTLGVPETAQVGAPAPVMFTNVEFKEGTNKNDIAVKLEAAAKTPYGTIERATLTVVATARGRRAGK